MKNHKFATAFVTLYLILYTVLHHMEAPIQLLTGMFVFSPFLVIWMAYSIIRYAPYTGKDLEQNEEWGYDDIDKNEL